jgi:hypothetical protein
MHRKASVTGHRMHVCIAYVYIALCTIMCPSFKCELIIAHMRADRGHA